MPVPPADGRARPLPAELAFLADAIPPDRLHAAAATAMQLHLPPERVAMAEGIVAPERYYRLLAAHLGLPFAERPLRPAPAASLDSVLRHGLLMLAPNPYGWHALAAPTGALLRHLLAEGTAGQGGSVLALTSPDRLEALLRQDRRAGVAHRASHGLAEWNDALSARAGLSVRQAVVIAAATLLLAAAAWVAPALCLTVLALGFSVGFLLAVAVRLAATAASPGVQKPQGSAVPEQDLPVYSVVAPLFREAGEVRRLTEALGRLDYPRAKLDILLVIESNDRATLGALERLRLPGCYRIVMAPPGRPQTKPRALNVALQFARGAFLVVYDAEDEPEPDQLRQAVAVFAAAPDVACLQAQLAIDNSGDSWLTRMFALEYAALFGVVNPGLAARRWPVPLGGTSNHFRMPVLRRVNGWDAWNVTEDIDLGIRLARFGFRVATLPSLTFEEAPRTLGAWMAQRRRWQKGWMVTLATHTRAPLRTWRELGFGQGLALWGLLPGTVSACLLGPFCLAVLVLRAWSGTLLHPRDPVDVAWSLLSIVLLAGGLASAVWPVWLGLARLGRLRLALWLPTLPVYLALLSLASWQAVFEVMGRPQAWSKTEHGRAKRRDAGKPSS